MITIENVTKRYGGFTAVDDVSFVAHRARSPASSVPTAPASPPACGSWSASPRRRRAGHDRRPPLRRHPQPGAPRRRAARRLRPARRPHRSRGAAPRRRHDGRGRRPGRGDARRWSGSRAPRPSAGSRNYSLGMRQRLGIAQRAAGRPVDPDPRRAGQRARPGRHPLDARPAAQLRRQRRDRAAVLAPAPRGRDDRRRDGADRARQDRRPGHQGRAAAHRRDLREAARTRRAARAGPARRGHRRHPVGRRWLPLGVEPIEVGRAAASAGVVLVELKPAEGAGLEEMFLQLTADDQRDGVTAEGVTV